MLDSRHFMSAATNDSFASHLLQTRKRRRLTQKQLADAIGVEKKSVYRWERKGDIPTRQNVKDLAAVLGVDADWLEGKGSAQVGLPEVLEYLRTRQVSERMDAVLRRFPFAELRALHPSEKELGQLLRTFETLPTEDILNSYLRSPRGADMATEIRQWLKSALDSPPLNDWVRTVDDVHTLRKFIETRSWEAG